MTPPRFRHVWKGARYSVKGRECIRCGLQHRSHRLGSKAPRRGQWLEMYRSGIGADWVVALRGTREPACSAAVRVLLVGQEVHDVIEMVRHSLHEPRCEYGHIGSIRAEKEGVPCTCAQARRTKLLAKLRDALPPEGK